MILWAALGPWAMAQVESFDLPGDALSWSGRDCFISTAGTDAGLDVSPDLVVAVLGRVDQLPGSRPHQPSAAEVAHAWRARGAAGLRGSRGDFVAVVHEPATGRTTAYRDLVGCVPLYAHQEAGGALVTTSLPGLARLRLGLRPDPRWVSTYLEGTWPAPWLTPYRSVRLVHPGSALEVAGGTSLATRVDDWLWAHPPDDLRASAERFRAIFDQAVARRLVRADGGTAVTTSGGLDSSSILVTARRVCAEADLTALCLRFKDPRGDESRYQDAVTSRAGAHVVDVDADRTAGPFGCGPDDLFTTQGGPPLVLNWFLHRAMQEAARSRRIARVLDGEDGDGVLGGHPLYLADLLARGHLLEYVLETTALARARGVRASHLARRSLGDVRRAAASRTLGRAYPSSVRGIVGDGYLSSLTAETHRLWHSLPAGVSHPYLDRDVLQYALALPRQQRVARGRSKVVLRTAMEGRLPDLIGSRRDKGDLSEPFLTAVTGVQRPLMEAGLQAAARDPAVRRACTAALGAVPSWDQDVVVGFRVAALGLWQEWLRNR